MKRAFFICLIFLAPLVHVSAHVPVMVEQTSLLDIDTISDPTLSQAFYGTLEGFPHTFEIRHKDPFLLHVEVLVPDTDFASNIVNGIIIRETGKKGRVSEVARLSARDATWETFFEPWGGDSYRRGGTFEGEVEGGVYRIEVSTPDNTAPYVLVVGTREDSPIGYFETIGRLIEVKRFFGKSAFAVIYSPLVYMPLLVLLCISLGYLGYRFYKRGAIARSSVVS